MVDAAPDDLACSPGFAHAALSCRSTGELVEEMAPLLRSWLSREDRVFVNVAQARLEALRAALGPDADRIVWSDTSRWFPHPARRLRALHELVDQEARNGSGQVRFVGECPFPATVPALVTEWTRFDSVLNEVLAEVPVTVVCTYDLSTLAPDIAEQVPCTHPLLGVGPVVPSERYRGLSDTCRIPEMLSLPPASALHERGRVAPARARELVRSLFDRKGSDEALSDEALSDEARSDEAPFDEARFDEGPFRTQLNEDLAVVVTELVTNAWQVGAPSIEVWCWRDGGELGIQVDDDGPGLRDPLAGYRRPKKAVTGGRGLWIARQMADILEIASSERGTSVRARFFESWGHGMSADRSCDA